MQKEQEMKLLFLLLGVLPVALSLLCPDQETRCDQNKTCCELESGGYGCCPVPNAVCCSDGEHCCPSGYTCDVSEGTCSSESEKLPWFEKEVAKNVHCGGKYYCKDGNTCCPQADGKYGCCPLPKAECCDTHCCPEGFSCDGDQCSKEEGNVFVAGVSKTEAVIVESVMCPDRRSECPDGSTCCILATGRYGCCPLRNAVCCPDQIHCCQNGFTCDPSRGSCSRGSEIMAWFEKTEATTLGAVICPGGQSECPDGNTCCLLSSGQYGCCPLPNAVCCSDHLHCCPNGYTCDVSGGTCSQGSEIMAWFEKTEATTVGTVTCPGGQSECPDGNTCCLLSSGQYGCCPLPNAVCCSDHLHCCPNGYTCDVSGGTCSQGSEIMAWFEKNEATTVGTVTCPGGQSYCPDGNTCCLLSSGQYGCCPLPNAVCCSDHLHCCPNGYTCDVSGGTCSQGSEIMNWFEKTEATTVGTVTCPGGQSECPDGNTCCLLSSGQYGCCPLPNAVCCSDHLHCCPNGYTCDVSGGTCSQGSEIMAWFEKTEATAVGTVTCPGGQSECPDGNTCCLLSSGQYGCCPLPNAVCCSDHLHCCPNGYTCDVSGGTCSQGSEIMNWFEKTEVFTVGTVTCPGGQSECPDGNTCCLLSSGQYGCCPLPNAVCCSDHLHCCPNGYTCDVSGGTCSQGSEIMAWFEKNEATAVGTVTCPGGQSECPDGNTCCLLSSGQYGCCPLPNAVCCSDHLHCCPNGYTCDVSGGTCSQGSEIMNWFEKTEATTVGTVTCPGGQSECPDGNTCCLLSSGQYGCCPLPNAVCCSDHLHCCPNGYTCDVSGGTCSQGSEIMNWFEKTEATTVGTVTCPGGQSECPDGNTCCLLSSGQYGCCPLPNAVCCSDHLHCCPNGYTCDVSQGTCSQGSEIMNWFEKTEATTVGTVTCPGGQSECPDGNTCCLLSSGQYGCCLLPNAVCCSDHLHCCPNGYTCDVSGGTCSQGSAIINWFEKTEATTVGTVTCPGGQSECPDGNTCCLLSSGQYGCCPLPNAVCCSDHMHCCPNGYTCDVSGGTCSQGSEIMAWFEKTEATTLGTVTCPGGQSECPDGNTCCLLSSGQYGCCPLPNAVCCSDHLHCCPNGYTCDVSQGTCSQGSEIMNWFEKTEAFTVGRVTCPGGQSVCPDGTTCCLLSSGHYRCCPLPNAVCCSDHLHCCPNGYTCDVSGGTCSQGSEIVAWFEKTEATTLGAVTCPGGQVQCPDGNTCCLLSSGQYGCCPLPNVSIKPCFLEFNNFYSALVRQSLKGKITGRIMIRK
ncbi:uncharacterized protein [Apostichopus japonicus]|uniref:uncharacterized protein n=1 Tax=Stichopus japonicus TaxID=307972 RepID=UPI003AB301AC